MDNLRQELIDFYGWLNQANQFYPQEKIEEMVDTYLKQVRQEPKMIGGMKNLDLPSEAFSK